MSEDTSAAVEATVREIRRKTRKKYSAEEKVRIVLEGLRGEEKIAELCRREGTRLPALGNHSQSFLTCCYTVLPCLLHDGIQFG